jgi:O-succinylbenzoic acid--CoA ligase
MPSHRAITCGTISYSFAALHQQASRLACQLATLQIGDGSRVALLARNGFPFAVAVHALTRLGAILVPLNTRLTKAELLWQLQDVQASYLLSDVHFAEQAISLALELPALHSVTLIVTAEHAVSVQDGVESDVELHTMIDLERVQSIMYTSGTTGNPKGVLITYGMQWWNAIGSALNLGHALDDCWLACLPLFHIGGLSILFRSVINGISVLLYEKFDAHAINRAIKEQHVTIISVVALMLQRMLADLDSEYRPSEARYPSTLRCVLLGGGPVSRPLLADCAARSIPVLQTYGLTESCSQAVTLAPSDALCKLGSVGRPLIQVQLRILTEQDQFARPNEPGVICLRGPSITPGYDHQAMAQALQDGWLVTDDIGFLDDEGYLYVLDRRQDLIISGGENIYPAQIESLLLSHPDVLDAGVCGQPDEQWGQVPIAFVCLRPGTTATVQSLHAFLATQLARYKQPRSIHIVTVLPRNAAGKLLRRELKALSARMGGRMTSIESVCFDHGLMKRPEIETRVALEIERQIHL